MCAERRCRRSHVGAWRTEDLQLDNIQAVFAHVLPTLHSLSTKAASEDSDLRAEGYWDTFRMLWLFICYRHLVVEPARRSWR